MGVWDASSTGAIDVNAGVRFLEGSAPGGAAGGVSAPIFPDISGGPDATAPRSHQFISMFIIGRLMKRDFSQRFGFLVNDVAKLHGEAFDRLARERIGLSRAQCRLLGVLAMNGDDAALSQTELAQRLGLSTMAVATLCDRMVAAGWIRREPSATDRRVNQIHLEESASKALDAALTISDSLQAKTLGVLEPAERAQLLVLLGKVRSGLMAASASTTEAKE
jgi:DNA-binding MarR family transcriptional regulator